MSGTPRCSAGIGVLPAGSTSWKLGRVKSTLYPPPPAIQPISRWAGVTWQFAGGFTLSTVVPVGASVQRYVPPTPVTSGSEAGHHTAGYGSSVPPLPTGDLRMPSEPKSPEDASTVTPAACASVNA